MVNEKTGQGNKRKRQQDGGAEVLLLYFFREFDIEDYDLDSLII